MTQLQEINPLMCDPDSGVCEIPTQANAPSKPVASQQKPVTLIYYTDPICSTCWGIEPQLRKLKLEYGAYFEVEYRMGGLLKSWDSYGGSDVRNPTDVAHHWDEVSAYYQMPIDGDVWLQDPLSSSYPPSVAFKAAQLQSPEKALLFLRRIREMVFLEKKNITKWEHLQQAATEVGLNTAQLKTDYEGRALELFNTELATARQEGVRGFPTIFFTDADDNRFKVYGFKPYEQYEEALLKLHPKALKKPIDARPESLFAQFASLTTKEFAELASKTLPEAEKQLQQLAREGKLNKSDSKNGPIWRWRK